MTPEIIQAANPALWAQFGPLGLVCLALFAFLWKILADHRAALSAMENRHLLERQEMRKAEDRRTEQMLAVQRETNAALNALTVEIGHANERWRRYDLEPEPERYPRAAGARP